MLIVCFKRTVMFAGTRLLRAKYGELSVAAHTACTLLAASFWLILSWQTVAKTRLRAALWYGHEAAIGLLFGRGANIEPRTTANRHRCTKLCCADTRPG